MGFLSNLFGGTFESNRKDGDSLFDEKEWGEARLAYERAIKKSADATAQEIAAVKDRMAQCRLLLARGRIDSADELAYLGEIEEARSMLEDAVDICPKEEIVEAVAERKVRYEAEAARFLASEEDEMTEEELLAVMAGTWTEAQADEYASLPDEFRAALLKGHDGDHEGAAKIMSRVIDEYDLPDPLRFAHFELGKELIGVAEFEAAARELETFVELCEKDEESRELVMAALTMLGRVLITLKRTDDADRALVRSTRIAPDNHVAFLNLGVFLRNREELERSLESLEKAVVLMGQMNPDFRVIREIAFTYLAMGREDEAEKNLYAVIEHQASQGNHDQFDPEAAVPLARLYESRGEIEKASDLFRHLAVGHDTLNHYTYNLEAARLLKQGGKNQELSIRYLSRARELASTQEEREAVETLASDAE